MARTKMVRGELVEITPAEDAARDLEETAAAAEVPPPASLSPSQIVDMLLAKGVITEADIDGEDQQ